MTLHLTPVVAKDGAGTTIPGGVQMHDTSGSSAGPNDQVAVLIDSTGAEILGTKADAKATQTDTTAVSAMSVWKQISASIQALAGAVTASKVATTVADGDSSTMGAKADAKSTATDTTPISAISILKQISASIQTVAAGGGGSAVTIADNANATFGAKADAKSTATDTTSISAMSVLKQISASVQAAATAVKQAALGTAGTASADVITIQGIASMTPVAVSAKNRLVAGNGVGLTWTALTGGNANSMIAADSVIVSSQIDNSSNLDQYADVSVSLGSVTPAAGSPFIGIGLLPLNEDGTTYANGLITTSPSANGIPGENIVGSISAAPSTAGVITGTAREIKLPPGKFVFVLYNGVGVTLASSANVVSYRTYNKQLG